MAGYGLDILKERFHLPGDNIALLVDGDDMIRIIKEYHLLSLRSHPVIYVTRIPGARHVIVLGLDELHRHIDIWKPSFQIFNQKLELVKKSNGKIRVSVLGNILHIIQGGAAIIFMYTLLYGLVPYAVGRILLKIEDMF